MKKLSFLALVVSLFSASFSFAQVVDSLAVDSTNFIDTAQLSVPKSPNYDNIGRSRGEIDEEGTGTGDEEQQRLQALEELGAAKEAMMDDAISYPLNLETEDLATFQVLDSIADQNRFIFTGEDHRVEKFNTVLEMKMMQYLNTKGYNYYLMEAGWVSAWMVNKYILEGDSAAEQILSTYYSKNFFALFRGLKETNDKLPIGRKIQAVGLDIERDAPLALRSLLMMLPNKQAPDSLEMFVESLKILSGIHIEQAKEYSENQDNSEDMFDFGGYTMDFDEEDYEVMEEPKYFYFNMMKTIQDLTQRFRHKEAEFKVYLGDAYPDFERAIKEMENWLIWIEFERNELPQSWVFREQYMEGNFRNMFKDKPEAKGFGQFGRCHITRVTKVGDCGFAFFSSLNKRIITKMPELENQLTSIGVFYGGLDDRNGMKDNGNISDLIDMTERGEVNLFLDLQDYGDEMLRTKFSSVIVVKSNNYRHTADFEEDEEFDWDPEPKFAMSFDFNRVDRNLNMNSFNNFTNFGTQGLFTNYEFGVTTYVGQTVGNSAFGFFPEVKSELGDTTTLGLKGWNMRYTWGRDLIKSKHFGLTPELGIGFMQLTYTEERVSAGTTYFGTPNYTEFVNPAFLFDARLNASVVIRFIELRGFVGYNWDVSKKSWKQQDNPVIDGPKTSFSSVYTGFGASLRFGGR